jgi:hypothetical protein
MNIDTSAGYNLATPRSDVEPNLAAPLAFSGQFIQVFEEGRLGRLRRLIADFQHELGEREETERDLSDLNNPTWLASWLRRGRAKKELVQRAQELELQLCNRRRRMDELRPQLEAEIPGLVASIERHHQSSPQARVRSNKKNRKHVRERNKVIEKYSELPTRQICQELDDAFPHSGDSPAPEFPRTWVKKFGVTTFGRAYLDKDCRPRVHRLISGARRQRLTSQ